MNLITLLTIVSNVRIMDTFTNRRFKPLYKRTLSAGTRARVIRIGKRTIRCTAFHSKRTCFTIKLFAYQGIFR
jgi:hypothetical protein